MTTNNKVLTRQSIFLILGILLIAANLRAPFTGLPPVLSMISKEYGLSTLASGLLTTLPLLAFGIISPFGSPIAKKYGLERSLLVALILIAVGILLRSIGDIICLYLGTAIIGIGIAIGNVLLPSLVKRDFPHKVALITGSYALSMGIAAALCSAMAIPLANNLGWRITLILILILPIAAVVIWFKQAKYASRPTNDTPDLPQHTNMWRNPLAWQITLFLGINSAIYYIAIGWLPMILVDSGMTASQAGSQHGILQLATAVPGLLLAPILAKMKDQRVAAVVSCIFSICALLGILMLSKYAFIWSFLFGIGTGAGIILGLTFIGLRTVNAHQAATLSGMSQSIGYLLAAAGPIIIGMLHDILKSWTIPLYLCVGLAIIAAIMGLLAGRNIFIDPEA